MRRLLWMAALAGLVACLALGGAAAEEAAPDNPLLGTYTLRTVYVSVRCSVSFEQHAKNMDGLQVEIAADQMRFEQWNGEDYIHQDPVYTLTELDEAGREAVLSTWWISDETQKRDYDLRMTIFDQYGDTWTEVFRAGETYWLVDIPEPADQETRSVMYVYEMVPVE